MGFNTAVIIHNDFLDRIAKDQKFGEKLEDAIRTTTHRPRDRHYYNGFDVLPSVHADYDQHIVIGQNSIRNFHDLSEDEAIRALKNLGAEFGFAVAIRKKKA